MLEKLDINEWLSMNAKLQKKKNALRKTLKDRGILKKGATNDFDKYNYFSEAQYKELFTELFSDNLLEFKASEIEYEMFEGTEKQANGRTVKFECMLIDVETGFYEVSYITGEGIDKGDKAGYKADTGALKYYLANNFMVATGDDPEKESPDNKMNNRSSKSSSKGNTNRTATPKQIATLLQSYKGDNLTKLLQVNNISKIEELPMAKASELISVIMSRTTEGDMTNE